MSLTILGIICPLCRDMIWSGHRHDFRHCKCEKSFVDGGRDYLRVGFTTGNRPTFVRIRYDDTGTIDFMQWLSKSEEKEAM